MTESLEPRRLLSAGVPTNFTATAMNDNAVDITWTPGASDGNTFEVQRRNADQSWSTLATVDDTTDGDAYVDYAVSGATANTYRVRANDGRTDGTSPFTDPATATTPLTTPDAPSDLYDTESSTGEVDLAWSESSGIVTGYTATATPVDGGTATTVTVDGDVQSATVTGLPDGDPYSFSVVAINDQGSGNVATSSASTAITATASAATLAANAPATVDEGSAFGLMLASDLPGGGPSPIASWDVAWADGSAASTMSGATGTITVTPAAGTAEEFATVTATDTNGVTFHLPEIDVLVVPAAPTAVTAVSESDDSVNLSWQNSTLLSAAVNIDRSDDGGATYDVIDTVDGSATSYVDSGLVSQVANSFTNPLDFTEDQVGRGGPHERLGFLVVFLQVRLDRRHERGHAAERRPADPLVGDLRRRTAPPGSATTRWSA